MVYDPVLSFEKAYAQGYGPLNLFNANGPTTINLGLEYYQPSNDTGYYKYGVLSRKRNIFAFHVALQY